MNIKVDFDNIVVKEDKNDFNVKVLMLKGEKGEAGATSWGAITGTLSNQTDLKNALDGKANQTDFNTVSGQVNTNTSNIGTINGQITDINGELDDFEDLFYGNATVNDEDTSITLDNTVEAGFENFDLKGNTTQDGTPTPSSPIPVNVVSGDNEIVVCGKNLLITNGWQNATISPDGSLNYSDDRLVSGYIPIASDTTKMVLSINISLDFLGIAYYDEGKTYISRNATNGNNKVVGTIPNNTKFVRVFIARGYTTMTINSFADYEMQIEYGENETTYEAPINNVYNIDLPVENLFDKNGNLELDYRLSVTGENFSEAGYYISEYIPINSNTTYTKNNPTADAYHRVCFYSNNDTTSFISKSENNTFTTPSNAKYLRFCGLQSELDTTQLEKGSKANNFTPYGTTPIELCKIGTYQDYIYKDSDKWYLYKAIGKIASYNGETITTSYISTTGGLDTGATVYYVLATPTNTEITYEPLITQLNLLEQAQSKENQTNISQVNNDLPFIIYAEAFANTFNGRIEGLDYKIDKCEVLDNKVTLITSGSTDSEYPSAKAVYDLFNSITDGDEVSY